MEIYKMESGIGERSTNRYYRFILSGTKMNSVYDEDKDYIGDDSIYHYDASEVSNLVSMVIDKNRYIARRISSDAFIRANMKYIHTLYRLYYNALSSYMDTSELDDEEVREYDDGKAFGINYLGINVSIASNRVCHVIPIIHRIKRMYIDVPMVIRKYIAKENNLSFIMPAIPKWDSWYQQTRVVDSIHLTYNDYHTSNYTGAYRPKRISYGITTEYRAYDKLVYSGDNDIQGPARPANLGNPIRLHKIKFKRPVIIHTNGTKGIVV